MVEIASVPSQAAFAGEGDETPRWTRSTMQILSAVAFTAVSVQLVYSPFSNRFHAPVFTLGQFPLLAEVLAFAAFSTLAGESRTVLARMPFLLVAINAIYQLWRSLDHMDLHGDRFWRWENAVYAALALDAALCGILAMRFMRRAAQWLRPPLIVIAAFFFMSAAVGAFSEPAIYSYIFGQVFLLLLSFSLNALEALGAWMATAVAPAARPRR